MARYSKIQIANYKMTKDFSEFKNIRSKLEVRPTHAKISISWPEENILGSCFGILQL